MKLMHLGGFALTLGLLTLAGCKEKSSPTPAASPPSATTQKPKPEEEENHAPGPHKGLIEHLGNLHFEFVIDHDAKTATVYLYGPSEKELKPHSIKAEKIKLSIKEPKFEIDLIAQPEAVDPKGRSSKFVGKDDRFGKVQEFAGEVDAIDQEPGGDKPPKPYNGEFAEKGHDHPEKKK